jgi:hypothetical protein
MKNMKTMECGEVLRNFLLNGLVIHLRGTKENPKNPNDVFFSETQKHNLQKMVQKSDPFKAKPRDAGKSRGDEALQNRNQLHKKNKKQFLKE